MQVSFNIPVDIPKNTSQSEPQGIENSFYKLFEFLISTLSISFEPMLRYKFGERYFTPFKFLTAVSLLVFITAGSYYRLGDFLIVQNLMTQTDINTLPRFSFWFFALHTTLFFFLGFWEFRERFLARKRGDEWHSYSIGETRFTFLKTTAQRLGFDDYFENHPLQGYFVEIYIEPLFLLTLGLGLFLFLPAFGSWLIGGSILLFIRMQILYSRFTKQMLDQSDTQIEAKYMRDILYDNDREYTKGFDALAMRPQGMYVAPTTSQIMAEVLRENPNFMK